VTDENDKPPPADAPRFPVGPPPGAPVADPMPGSMPGPMPGPMPGSMPGPMPGPMPEPMIDSAAPPLAAGPASVSDADLVDAVGARVPRKERKRRDKEMEELAKVADEEELDPAVAAERRGRRKMIVILALSIAVGLGITAFLILGRINKDVYAITCSASEVRAEQGRGFPPWGTAPLEGPEWKAIAIPPNAECHAHEVDDRAALATEYMKALVEQAQVRLTAKDVTEYDLAARQLDQALLLAREPSHRDARKDIERLLGDVEYWRATARLKASIEEMNKAAQQFDAAAERKPHHVGDAAAWAALARRAAALIGGGPNATSDAPVPASGAPVREAPPFGVALPVETPDAAPASATPPGPPDASVLPSGGVLL
jgi:hypothetical protein